MLTNAVHRFSFACAFALSLAAAACGGEPVGRICDLGNPNTMDSESIVASPSLDCVSRTCLKVTLEIPENQLPDGSTYPHGGLGLCTDRCEQDADCERVPESPCQTGFTCAVPVSVGPFCCEKFCICKDYLVIPEGGRQPPQACEDKPTNTCCNLPNRAGNPMYPNCP